MLRPTPGDPWGVEQHHWNTGAKENQHGHESVHGYTGTFFTCTWMYAKIRGYVEIHGFPCASTYTGKNFRVYPYTLEFPVGSEARLRKIDVFVVQPGFEPKPQDYLLKSLSNPFSLLRSSANHYQWLVFFLFYQKCGLNINKHYILKPLTFLDAPVSR